MKKIIGLTLLLTSLQLHANSYDFQESVTQTRSIIGNAPDETFCAPYDEKEFVFLENKLLKAADKSCSGSIRTSRFRYRSQCERLHYAPEVKFRRYSIEASFSCPDQGDCPGNWHGC